MAFFHNWRVRCVQQIKWAGWAFLTISCLNPGPYRKLQDFFLIPPLNQTSPACSHLLTLILAALWACLSLSSLSRLVPSCTHTHTDTQIHTHTYTHTIPKALPCWALAELSDCPGDWLSSLYLQALLGQTASKSNSKTEVLNSPTLSFLYPTFFCLHVFLTVLARHLPYFFK